MELHSPAPVKPDSWWRKDGRLRPTLRALLFLPSLVIMFVLTLLLGGLLAFVWVLITHPQPSMNDVMHIVGTSLFFEIAQAVAVLTVSWLFCWLLDRRSWLDLGYRVRDGALRQGLEGWLLGAGMQTCVVLLGLVSGVYALTYNWGLHGSLSRWLLYFVTMALVALGEEAIFRGYLLQTLAEAAGKLPAALITAVLFGAAHLANPGAGWGSTLGITVFGLWQAYAVFRTRSLWLPMGMHMMWNVFEGVVYGLPNSGNPERYSIWLTQAHGPAWWTGGTFGPEAGLLSVLALGVSFAVLRYRLRHG